MPAITSEEASVTRFEKDLKALDVGFEGLTDDLDSALAELDEAISLVFLEVEAKRCLADLAAKRGA